MRHLAHLKYCKIMSIPVPQLRELHYLFTTKSHGRVVAHCLDIDIVTAANDIAEAEKRLDCLVRLQIEEALATGNFPALVSDSSPAAFFDTFNECIRSGRIYSSKNPTLRVRVPEVIPMDTPFGSIGVIAALAANAATA